MNEEKKYTLERHIENLQALKKIADESKALNTEEGRMFNDSIITAMQRSTAAFTKSLTDNYRKNDTKS